MKLGIIGAMKIEVDELKNCMENVTVHTISNIDFFEGILEGVPVVVAVSGIGKVNAAVCAQTMILSFSPDRIINVGVAGGLADGMHVGDIAVAQNVVQHDMDTSPVGDPVGFISGIDTVEIPCDTNAYELLYNVASTLDDIQVFRGTIASGDQFINSDTQRDFIKTTFKAIAAEMEGASIGQVCYINQVPFSVLRVISDSADGKSHLTYAEFTHLAVKTSMTVLLSFLKMIGGALI